MLPHRSAAREDGSGSVSAQTRPTYAAYPRQHAPSPRTHAAPQAPTAHPRRTRAPRTQERPEHTRPGMHPLHQPPLVLSALKDMCYEVRPFPDPLCHQEKTCEDITPYGVITQFPKNGRLFTPKYRFLTPSTFDHTEKNLFTPSIFKITPS